MQHQPPMRLWPLAPGCFLLAGCVTKAVGGSGTSFHYRWWLPVGILVAGVALVPIGRALRKFSGRLGWALIVLGPVTVLGIAPMLFLERVFVHDGGFEVRSGFWGKTACQEVDFDTVRSVRMTKEVVGSRRSRLIWVLYFDRKAGETARLPLNNDVKIEASNDILARTTAIGIPFSGAK